jgi:Domain of unknown function (DUF4258)
MKDGDPPPRKLSRAEATRVVKSIGADPDRIVPVRHAVQRMRDRGIAMTLVRRVVRAGFMDGDPWLDEHGNWRVTMRGRPAGELLTVGVAIEWRRRLLIITVF